MARPPGACLADGECGASSWCSGTTHWCTGVFNTAYASYGSCHKDCSHGACMCFFQEECPYGYCDGSGHCASPPPPPPAEPCGATPPCMAGCTVMQRPDQWCPVCMCPTCPSPLAAKTGLRCGNKTCAANEFCVSASAHGSSPPECVAQDPCVSDPTCGCFTSSGILQCSGNPRCGVDDGGIVHCPI